jgi:hypothetical protein
VPPYFRCGPCPVGYRGDGIQCVLDACQKRPPPCFQVNYFVFLRLIVISYCTFILGYKIEISGICLFSKHMFLQSIAVQCIFLILCQNTHLEYQCYFLVTDCLHPILGRGMFQS